jgi:hypothetical protein
MAKPDDMTREPAWVRDFFYGVEDHGILTCTLTLALGETGSSVQSFGGLALSESTGPDFKETLAAFFCRQFDALVGEKCYALRAFRTGEIEGLEHPDGRRFLLYRWRKKHYPETPTPLAAKTAQIHREIAFLRRRLGEEERRLLTVQDEYVDWLGDEP